MSNGIRKRIIKSYSFLNFIFNYGEYVKSKHYDDGIGNIGIIYEGEIANEGLEYFPDSIKYIDDINKIEKRKINIIKAKQLTSVDKCFNVVYILSENIDDVEFDRIINLNNIETIYTDHHKYQRDNDKYITLKSNTRTLDLMQEIMNDYDNQYYFDTKSIWMEETNGFRKYYKVYLGMSYIGSSKELDKITITQFKQYNNYFINYEIGHTLHNLSNRYYIGNCKDIKLADGYFKLVYQTTEMIEDIEMGINRIGETDSDRFSSIRLVETTNRKDMKNSFPEKESYNSWYEYVYGSKAIGNHRFGDSLDYSFQIIGTDAITIDIDKKNLDLMKKSNVLKNVLEELTFDEKGICIIDWKKKSLWRDIHKEMNSQSDDIYKKIFEAFFYLFLISSGEKTDIVVMSL